MKAGIPSFLPYRILSEGQSQSREMLNDSLVSEIGLFSLKFILLNIFEDDYFISNEKKKSS